MRRESKIDSTDSIRLIQSHKIQIFEQKKNEDFFVPFAFFFHLFYCVTKDHFEIDKQRIDWWFDIQFIAPTLTIGHTNKNTNTDIIEQATPKLHSKKEGSW